MYQLVRKTLEIYLTEKRIPGSADIPADLRNFLSTKESVFVTLYHNGKIIASSGRINCKKENTVYECIDNTLICLRDPRFSSEEHKIDQIYIRVDRFTPPDRRMVKEISEVDASREGIILLSQNYGTLSVILPYMVKSGTSSADMFSLACQKAGLDEAKITPSDYVLYALVTKNESDFG